MMWTAMCIVATAQGALQTIGTTPAVFEGPLADWSFVLGDWETTQTQRSRSGVIEWTCRGESSLSLGPFGAQIHEALTNECEHGPAWVFTSFVVDDQTGTIEASRTDSEHAGFWVITGSVVDGAIVLSAKHQPEGQTLGRQIVYERDGSGGFRRVLRFSNDGGESWWERHRVEYRRPAS